MMGFFRLPDVFYTAPAAPTHHKVKYGKQPTQFLNVRVPDGTGPFPTILTIHGGQWKKAYTHKQMEYLCEDLKQHGIATCNLEYKRLGHVGGGYPGTFLDLLDAAELVLERADEWRLDRNNISILGHSSGAHLGFCLAGHNDFEGRKLSFRPRSLVGIAGVYDLDAANRLNPLIDEFFGANPRLSPIKIPISCHRALIVGEEDKLIEQARSYVAEHPEAALKVVDKCGHFRVIDPTFPEWPKIRETILSASSGDGT